METPRYVIAGAGGFGREVEASLYARFAHDGEGEFLGYLDDNPSDDLPILSSIGEYEPNGEMVLVAIGSPSARREVVERLAKQGARFGTHIHPTAIVGPRVTLGEGTIVCAYSVLTTDIVVGEQVIINLGCTIGHDSRVGDFVTFAPGCGISGYTTIESGAELGTHAVTIPGKTLCADSVLGAGAVLTKNATQQGIYVGMPAQLLVPKPK